MNHCLNCNSQTTNPKFCNRSCSSSYNNKKNPRRNRTKKCANCDNLILKKNKYCKSCYQPNINHTLADITSPRRYQKHSQVRDKARRVYEKSNKPKCCAVCGYDKHYHICHIKAIKDFPLNTLVSTINHIDNLIALCPNHHWELDNDNLKLL